MRINLPRPGLQLKIVAWSFIPTALILFGVAVFILFFFQATLEALTIENNRETTEVMAKQIGAELAALTEELNAVARTPELLGGDVARTRAILQAAARDLADFDGGLVIFNSEGLIVAAEPPRAASSPEDWSGDPFFRQMFVSSGPVVSDIFTDRVQAVPVVGLAVPFRSADGRALGALAGLMRVDPSAALTRRLSSFRTWFSTDAYDLVHPGAVKSTRIVDHNGRIVFHSEASQVGRDVSSESVVQAVVAGKHGPVSTAEFRNQPVVTYFVPVPNTGWGFLVEQERSAVIQFYQRYFQLQTVLFALALIVPAGLVAFGVRHITEPIRQVTAASRRIAAGDLAQQVQVQTGDELEELADQFNGMSAQVRESVTALEEREERLALVIQATNDGIWDWDLLTDQVYFSPRWKAMLGYADDEIGNNFDEWRRRVHPDDLPRALALIEDYIQGRTTCYELEHRLQHKDGSYRWVLARGISLRASDGKPCRMVGSHTDITDRKRIEETLQQRLAFERLITGISTEFINLAPDQVDQGIVRALQTIGQFAGVDRSYVFLLSGDGATMDNTHEWCAPGIESFITRLKAVPVDAFPWLMQRLVQLQVVHVPRLDSLPDEASAEKQEFDREKIQSLINVPVAYRGRLVGFLGLDAVRVAKSWSDDTIALLRIVGEIFANALEHKREALENREAQQALERSEARFRSMFEHAPVGMVLTDGPVHKVNRAAQEIIGYTEDEIAHMGPLEYIHPEDWAVDEKLHAESEAGARERYQMEKRYIHRDGRTVWSRFTHAILRDEQKQPLLHIAVLEDITAERKAQAEKREAYESLERRVQERTRELAALNSIAGVVSQSLELKEIMRAALEQTIQVCGMDAGAAYELEEQTHTFVLAAAQGLSEEFAHSMGARVPVPAALPSRKLDIDRPLTWQVAQDYPESKAKQGVLREGLQSLFTVPLVAKGKIVGSLAFGSKTPRLLTTEESALLLAAGRQVGIAVDNARLYKQAQRTATTAERSRLARELHDSVTQSLYSVMLYAEAAGRSLADKEIAEAGDFLHELRDTAQDALREMRLLIFELRPPTLEKDGLIGALRKRLSAVEGRGGIQTELQVNGDRLAEQLPFAWQEALYHIVQEALNNVIRHAHARSVQVSLQFSESAIQLQVSDDGIGFDPENPSETSGLGLRGMRERVQRLGGAVQFASAPGQGTKVMVAVPTGIDRHEPTGGQP